MRERRRPRAALQLALPARRPFASPARVWAYALTLACLSGCASNPASPEQTNLVVFAASSLTDAFGELARAFESEHPEVQVVLNLSGSQALRLQLAEGAPADVFASAHVDHVRALTQAGLLRPALTFARNRLVLAVPAANPAQIDSFEQLPRAERLVIGAREVPIGRYTRALLDRAEEEFGPEFTRAVKRSIVSREANVRLVLAKVELGEADAAIVYQTDAAAAGSAVRTVPIPPSLAQYVRYQGAALRNAPHGALAQEWLQWLRDERGGQILQRHGFDR